jgi:glutamyl-tRNA synthetase
VQPNVDIVINDAVQGDVTINTNTIEDFIICRSDGTPVYMLAVVCDDIDMQISHVIRGVDHLSNTAKQILIYNAFGVQLPVFAHIPLIHGQDGAKLSKRHGAVSATEYKNQGYLPEAMRAYLLRLGWGTNHDNILNDSEAIQEFDLDGIGRSPSQFDFAKLQSVNEHFIKNSQNDYLYKILKNDYNFDFENVINPSSAINLVKNRSKTLLELQENLLLFQKKPPQTAPIPQEKLALLQTFIQSCNDNDNLHDKFQEYLKNYNVKFKDIGPEFRMILIGTASSIAIFDIIAVLGFNEAKNRILQFKI